MQKLGKSWTGNANHYRFHTLENWQFFAENLSTRGQFQAICDNREHPQWPKLPDFFQKRCSISLLNQLKCYSHAIINGNLYIFKPLLRVKFD